MTQFLIRWKDAGRWPKNPPDPRYPEGVDVIGARPGQPACKADVPYPAARIGAYQVMCNICGNYAWLLTAGRADDPRSVTIPCRPMASA